MRPLIIAITGFAVLMLIQATILPGNSAHSETSLPTPSGPVVLSVSGKVTLTNADGRADFDMAMLQALPQTEMRTFTDWTEGEQVFVGPSMKDLLTGVGAEGDVISASALNGYAIQIPVTDLERHKPIIAILRNGEPMSVRDKGPLWIIYPNEDQDTLTPNPNNDKSVWQLRGLEIR
ncbi:MAG: oxidoreductase [Alphaproteobacteria bacterium]|nr:oxidoreductase [Alphaproteobacteria bacterium]